MAKRDSYNYTYRVGRRVSHRGITINPSRRHANTNGRGPEGG